MKKSIRWIIFSALSAAMFNACDDASTSSPANECNSKCSSEETCIDGTCKCGDSECTKTQTCKAGTCVNDEPNPEDPCNSKCSSEETCIDGTCKCGDSECTETQKCQNGTCVEDAPAPEDKCDNKCSENESCIDGSCMCGDSVCTETQKCEEGECIENTQDESKCGGKTCASGETCVAEKCMCGNEICLESQTCNNGICEDGCDGDGCEEEEKCDPECPAGQICVEGECTIDNVCEPECSESEICVAGTCIPDSVDLCADVACDGDAICTVSGQNTECRCGSTVCADDQICSSGTCKWKDPCHDKTCNKGEQCVNGTCVANSIIPDATELDIMLSSLSTLTVTKSTTAKLTWKLDKEATTNLFCKMSGQNKYVSADQISKCIEVNNTQKTESVTFISRQRTLDNYTLHVSDGNSNSVDVKLTLKPYFDYKNFVKMSSGDVYPNGLTYRNCLAPGHKNKDKYNTHIAKGGTDTKSINLGGTGNDKDFHTFTKKEVDIIDHDMYTKYVAPNLLKHNNSYYGTRASVVAAARFLILQFPYDISYFITNNSHLGASHYIWSTLEKANSLSEVAVTGLNLDTNMYNLHTDHTGKHIINTGVQRWGDIVSHSIKEGNTYKTNQQKTKDYDFAGLECSGFVTWSFRNGKLGLGDWTTHIFGNDKGCYAKSDGTLTSTATDKHVRKYRCKSIANGTRTGFGTRTANNELNSVYAKLNGTKDANGNVITKGLKSSDFIALNPKGKFLTESELKAAIKNVKAGDLLWNGAWENEAKTLYSSGHVAMIIGVERDSNGDVTGLYVGEAIHRSGNSLSKYPTLKDFVENSSWMTNKKRAAFIIRMDNVYNYYSDKYGITDKSEKSDCPDGKKSGGNCYNYTDMFDKKFNDAIKAIKLKE